MKGILITIIILLLIAIAAFFLFGGIINSGVNSQQYQTPSVSNNAAASNFSALDLTPNPGQIDILPISSSDIPAP